MIDYVIYGKIIIDTIRLLDGRFVPEQLGGGGPQGAFGARLWADSVGLLTRSGTDMPAGPEAVLRSLGVDLQGWQQYSQHQTPRGLMAYDDQEYMLKTERTKDEMARVSNSIRAIIAEVLPIPADYETPQVIHLITEYFHEPMADEALRMKDRGAIYSLEPIIDHEHWSNREALLAYLPKVDTVSPDWPSASGLAESKDPKEVLKFWSKLGTSAVSIRHGIQGSYVWDKYSDKMWHIPIVRVNAVDPTGCGNSYGGGFAVGWHEHKDAKIAGCMGTISASFLAREIGVIGVTPQAEREAKSLLSQHMELIQPI